MNQDDVLRLLVADASLNDSEMFISVLRNAGHAVRATRIQDQEDLRETLSDHAFELFLCSLHLDELPLADAAYTIQESARDLPLIAVADEDSLELRRESMQSGAFDLVCKNDLEHLKLVVRRELTHLRQRRRLYHMEKALKESERRCSALLDSSRDAIAYIHEGMHIYANQAYLQKFGVDGLEDIEGTPILDMITREDQTAFKNLLRRLAKGDSAEPEMRVAMVVQDHALPVHVSLSAASVEGEACTQVLIRGESGHRDLEAQPEAPSRKDFLTGLSNRMDFLEVLADGVRAIAPDDKISHGLLYIQVDNLGSVRQTLGLDAWDKVVQDVAQIVSEQLDNGDSAGRFADDVFLVLLPHRNVHDTLALAEAVRERVEGHIVQAGKHTVTSTCTVGAVMVDGHTLEAKDAIAAAHQACEAARATGGNRVHLYAAEERENPGGGNEGWQDVIEDALEQNRFYLVYMPVASLTGDTSGRYEVRIRLRGEDGVELVPTEFVAHAEHAGIMAKVDRWVVDNALRALKPKLERANRLMLMIKLSGPTLSDYGFVEYLDERMNAYGIKGHHLNFEIDEPVAVTQLNDARRTFDGLKALGCAVTLDHFGSGANPFQLLKHLPADYLKLDRSLGQGLAANADSQERVKSIIENARSMHKHVIGGYVEDAMTMAAYWRYQADFVQGHFLQAPTKEMNYDFSGTVI
ncbi:EAL domain-containing protein [Aquisalimonas sp.]|uniref:EAL domain-containing response regulator n=1 Tax=Aquisalimonas sp. TaxID=1872621 RepID=UPI0025C0332D|nr:EAL domain-containing protein [Aquisalimonas sp.]